MTNIIVHYNYVSKGNLNVFVKSDLYMTDGWIGAAW